MSDEASLEEKKQKVREALRKVVDPEIGLSVTELGLVRKIEIAEDHAHLVMILTTPFCPYAPQLLEITRKTAEEVLGVPTTIELGLEPWSPDMMEDEARTDWGMF